MSKIRLLLLLIVIALAGQTSQAQSLVHYWNFNNSASIAEQLIPTSSLVTGATISHIPGGISAIQASSNTGQGFDVTNPNARNGDVSGTHLRFNDPIGGGLLFSIPTTGYGNIVVKYGTRRSGSGAGYQFIEYTTTGIDFIPFDTLEPVNGNPTVQTLDFSALADVNNNPLFAIRITFAQGAGGTVGNNRFDNFSLEGDQLGGDSNPPIASFYPVNNAVNLSPSLQPVISFNEDIRLVNNLPISDENADTLFDLYQEGFSGTPVAYDAVFAGNVFTITPLVPLENGAAYVLSVKPGCIEDLNNNVLTGANSVNFSIISLQTQFQPGDIVPVAYRMNATSTEDEIALLSLVDILPGTLIHFTDAKYTNAPIPQCSGGFEWEAPAAGLTAGTVLSIQTSALVCSHGTVSGSGFGLSSNGDQVLVYTGSSNSASHITALSANAWVLTNSSCSGSNSQLPAGLSDGISSINLSTAPANVSGLTVNAYYNGPMQGTNAQLRSWILDPANWEGTGSGTAPQTWPVWAFPGPPSVVSAAVTSANSIRVIFSTDMDPVSAEMLSHYSGIAGLSSAVLTSNGTLADTVVLVFTAGFTSGTSYSLAISGVKDSENRSMNGSFNYSFTYNTTVSWEKKYITTGENSGSIELNLKLSFPSVSTLDVAVKGSPFSTADNADHGFTNQTLSFDGNSAVVQTFSFSITDDMLAEEEEYVVLSLENASGLSITGSPYITIFIKDNDRQTPQGTQELKLNYVSSFKPNTTSGSTTEIVAYDKESRRLFMTSAIQGRLDIADFSNPTAISLISSVDMSPYGGITSVAVKNGLVAVASPNTDEQLDGSVVFFNTNGDFLKQVSVGALPDMITFSPDGNFVLTANEGQPNDAYTVDPEGSVSIVDISGGISALDQADVTTLLFTDYNAQEAALLASGVRKLKSTSTLSQDFEPEYISISSDGTKAWVTLQENNAIAEINLSSKSITDVWALGMKDYSAAGMGFDASDKTGTAILANFNVKGYFIPDGVASVNMNGSTYLFTANEGDEKEYGGLNERTTVGASGTLLDPTIYPNAAVLKEDHMLGRLRMTNLNGDTDGDGDYDQISVLGGRSFSIFNATTKSLVFDSGRDFEQITSTHPLTATIFNCDNENNTLKSRSRAKGPEAEGIIVRELYGQLYAFVSLERVGGVMVYNVTDPEHPVFVDYNNNRSLTTYTGDHGPEGIELIDAASSPDGRYYIVLANEISGTISIYSIGIEGLTGPSSSQAPYLNPVGAERLFTSILSVNDSVNSYSMVGIPDGLGAYDNGDSTFTLLMNHELGNTVGVTRAHGSKGAFISKWTISKNDLQVISGQDLVQQVHIWNGTGYTTYNASNPSTLAAFNRLCSADLPKLSAFYNASENLGSSERIFMNGEESGSEGRAFAHVVTGPEAGNSYELPWLGKFSWENSVASPASGTKTVVVGLDDVTGGQVYVYVGSKTNMGTEIDKAGLTNGKLYGIAVTGLAAESSAGIPAPGSEFSLADLGYVQNITGAQLQTASVAAGVTSFLRPEDGVWDPANPNDFYFVTTNSFSSPSRLWKLHFTDILNPEAGGTLTAMLDGTEGPKMMDNLTMDNYGHILIQEDPGSQDYLAKVWQYNVYTDELELAGEHTAVHFSPGASAFLTKDEESSGIIDMEEILGPGMFILTVQAHYPVSGQSIEGGQLLAFYNPATEAAHYAVRNFSGVLQYDNTLNTVLAGASIRLKQNGTLVAQTTTDAAGHYLIENPGLGDYAVEVDIPTAWGGVNATDAQAILRHFTGSQLLQGLKIPASDVNASGFTNAADALSAAKRFTGLTAAFVAGDWYTGTNAIHIDGKHMPEGNLVALCYGDVDGSYIPGARTEPLVQLKTGDVFYLNPQEIVDIPVHLEKGGELGAISLVIEIPQGMEVLEVIPVMEGTLVSNVLENQIRIAWFTENSQTVMPLDVLFRIKLRITSRFENGEFLCGNESQLSDANGNLLTDKLLLPKFGIRETSQLSSTLYPNPLVDLGELKYILPSDGHLVIDLYNAQGQQIASILDAEKKAGSHNESMDFSRFSPGIYFLRMEFSNETLHDTQMQKLIINP